MLRSGGQPHVNAQSRLSPEGSPGPGADPISVQHHVLDPSLGEAPAGGQPGLTRADDGDVAGSNGHAAHASGLDWDQVSLRETGPSRPTRSSRGSVRGTSQALSSADPAKASTLSSTAASSDASATVPAMAAPIG